MRDQSNCPNASGGDEALKIASLQSSHMKISRIRYDGRKTLERPPAPQQDGFALIVQLRAMRSHTLWRDGHCVHDGGHARGSITIADLSREIRCQYHSPMDLLWVHLERGGMQDWANREDLRLGGLTCSLGVADGVAHDLAQALLPSFGASGPAQQLFVDQVALALQAHVAMTYGEARPRTKPHGLSDRQLARAMAFLSDHAVGELDVASAAAQCDMPDGAFAAAFQDRTGRTLAQWAEWQRIERSKALVLKRLAAPRIAVELGYASPAAFRAAFLNVVGMAPEAWRRYRQGLS